MKTKNRWNKFLVVLMLTLVVVALGSTSTPARAADVNLRGYWTLDGNANDSSGYGNDGTLTGGSWSASHAPTSFATTVTNANDSGPGSLRQAIASASNGDTITFDNDYTITLASQLDIVDKTVTITGAGHHITISGNNAVRIFHVGDYDTGKSGNLTIDHLNIVNGASKVNECAGSEISCGGGLMLEYLTTATVSNCTFSNNDGGFMGGAIYSYYGNPLTVTNSTFVNNHSIAYGGAIGFFYGNAMLTNNTFTGNSTGGYGSTFLNTWGTVTLRNNIFIKGGSVNACDSDFADGGSTNDGGGNVRYGDSTCPGTTIAPLLGTSGYYGGDVSTLPLLPGSGAFSAATANCPATDARGVARGATCDAGAFESQGFTLAKTGGDNQAALINTAFANPLTLSVTSAYGEPVNGGIITFTAPVSGASAVISGSPATIANGGVSISATANGTAGSYNVSAGAAGATGASFSLTNAVSTLLTINFASNGGNKVESTSPDQSINCLKGSSSGCSASYTLGTAVTLKATPDWKSIFMGWSGDYVSSDNPGMVTMTANKTVTATFDPNNKAKLIPGDTLFASIQDAYTSVQSGSLTIRAQTWSFPEDLIFANSTAVTLTGGMDANYNPTSGYSTVKSLTVGTGSAVIGNIMIK